MNKPTKAQEKEFWEWCGFEYEKIGQGFKPEFVEFYGWRYPDYSEPLKNLPPIDLNNLFKYAVPKAVSRLEEEYGWEALREFFKRWMHKMGEQSDHLEYVDFALALFWALWQVKERSNE